MFRTIREIVKAKCIVSAMLKKKKKGGERERNSCKVFAEKS